MNYAMKADLAGGFLETLEPVVPRGLVLSQVDGIREVGGDVEQHRTTDQRLREPVQFQDVKLKTGVRRNMNKLKLYKIRNKLQCIKENGYFERADSCTRDASRNYKLKSAKTRFSSTLPRCGIIYQV